MLTFLLAAPQHECMTQKGKVGHAQLTRTVHAAWLRNAHGQPSSCAEMQHGTRAGAFHFPAESAAVAEPALLGLSTSGPSFKMARGSQANLLAEMSKLQQVTLSRFLQVSASFCSTQGPASGWWSFLNFCSTREPVVWQGRDGVGRVWANGVFLDLREGHIIRGDEG